MTKNQKEIWITAVVGAIISGLLAYCMLHDTYIVHDTNHIQTNE